MARQRILEAALQEFSQKGYANASLNVACAQHNISKGIVYHYFQDKDEIYLACVAQCFDALAAHMRGSMQQVENDPEKRLEGYFNARLHFFAQHPLYLGLFADATFSPPAELAEKLAACRRTFDALNEAILTGYLSGQTLREGLSAQTVVEDVRLYMDFFNTRFRLETQGTALSEAVVLKHEERCRRQLKMLLHGVLEDRHE